MTVARPFTPTREDPRDLDARTVGAESGAVIDRIAARIDAAASGNLAHTLVVGPRGAGKTHALAVARERSQALGPSGSAVAVVVPEDAHGIVTYTELLGAVGRGLGVRLEPGVRGDVGQVEARIGDALGGRVLVLVVENLDRLFAKLGRAGQHDLRAWVETTRQVLILASTPMLFDGVQRRDGPWFGSFVVEPLGELTADDGSELLTRLRGDDTELVPYLATESGRARVQALHALTGGSPRLWTIFADVVTVELLDELVPAVERLLEELVTYYQQRIWDLGPNEERVVIALGTGAVSQTATGLAHELGLDRNTVGTTLGRLEEARWVRGGKVAGTDQRSTWYELREPLLRHYLQYRNETTSELTLVVEMLRRWFDPGALEAHLLSVGPGSLAERYVGAALDLVRPLAYDDGYDGGSPESLLLQARRWITDPAIPAGFTDAGVVVEAVLARAGMGDARPCPDHLRAVVDAAAPAAADLSMATVGRLLDTAAAAAVGPVADVLAWLAAAWWITTEPVQAEVRLTRLAARLDGPDDLLAVHVAHDLAYLRGQTDPAGAAAALVAVEARRAAVQGPDHPDTLLARANRAHFLAVSGDAVGSVGLWEEVVADRVRVLGDDHPATLTARHSLAYRRGQAGDVQGALADYRAVAADEARVLGPDHLDTLTARHQIGYYLGQSGDSAGAVAELRTLLEDRTGVLGPDHPSTLASLHTLAYYLGEVGDHAEALGLFREVTADRVRVLGPDDPETMKSRHSLALYLGTSGDVTGALAAYREIVADRTRVHGPDHPETFAARHQLAYFLGESGDPTAALAAYRELVADRTPVQGPEPPEALRSRHQMAFYELATGDPVAALVTASGVARDAASVDPPDPALEQAATSVIAHAFVETVQQGRADEVPEVLRTGVLAGLFDAAGGSEVALAQVPAEIRDLLRDLAAGRDGVSGGPTVEG